MISGVLSILKRFSCLEINAKVALFKPTIEMVFSALFQVVFLSAP